MEKLSNDFALDLVDRNIKKYMTTFLLDRFGYRFKREERIPDDLIGDYYQYKFLNDKLKLELTILFHPQRMKYPCSFDIYLSLKGGGSMRMRKHLQNNALDSKFHRFSYNESKQSFKEFVDGFFIFIRSEFEGYFKDYLTGNKFEDTPIDWVGMK